MKKLSMLFACMAFLAAFLTAQSPSPQGKLEGVWKITEVTSAGENAFKLSIPDTHPNLLVVSKNYFCFFNLTTPTRPDLPEKGATDAQKVATWTPVVAWAGTYELKGNILTTRFTGSKNPSEMVKGNFTTNEIKFEGNTYTSIPKTNQNGPIANPIITKFVRVE